MSFLKHENVLSVYLSNLMAQGIGRFMSMSANFVAYVLIARYYGAGALGKFIYILNFISISIVIVEFGTTNVISKQIAQLQRNEAEYYWGTFLILRALVYLILVGPIIGVAYMLRPDLLKYSLWCILGLPFLASRFFEPVYQIYGRPWYSALSNGCFSIVWLALVLVIIYFFNSLGWLITGYIVSNIFYSALAFYLASHLLRARVKMSIDHTKSLLLLALPIGVSSIFYWVNFRIGIFMLSSMRSDIAVGLYSLPFRVLEITVMMGVVLMSPLIPIFSELAQDNVKTLKIVFTRIFEALVIVVLPIVIIAPFVTKGFIHILLGNKFIETAGTLNIIPWIGMWFFLNLLFSFLNLSLGVVRYGYWNAGVALILTVVLNYKWIPEYGYLGCAKASLVSEIFLFCVAAYYSFKNIGKVFRFSRWFYILGANSILFLWLKYNVFRFNVPSQIVLAIGVYFTLMVLTRCFDVPALLYLLRQGKRAG